MSLPWIPITLASAIGIAILLSHRVPMVSGDLEPVLQRCCQSGETWAVNHTTCTGPPQESGIIPAQDRLTCLTSLYICCVRTHRRMDCERGKEAAKEGRQCGSADDTFRDCCDGCRLGIQAGIQRMPCGFLRFSFGAPWDEAYINCCEKSSSNQGVSQQTRRVVCEPNAPCAQICEVVENRVQCSCYPGYKLGADQATCEDVDECQLGTHTCNPASEFCSNLVGGFTCMSTEPEKNGECPSGLVKNQQTQECEDFDECTLQPCPRDGLCINAYGSYLCDYPQDKENPFAQPCPQGFAYSETNGLCVDVDECSEGIDKCNRTLEICQNSHGSYQCINKPTRSKDCPAGFKWNDGKGNCEDIDECQQGTHSCHPRSQNCVNAIGSYRCVNKASCPHGYRLVANKCEDVNECKEYLDDCDRRTEVCVNTQGSFQCQTQALRPNCGSGFVYDASRNICTDIDECDVQQPCQEDQTCQNTIGSYTCSCPPGFVLDVLTRQCRDVNECQLGMHVCAESQRCDNTLGSYTCVRVTSCGTGYTLNAATGQCEDDDECILNTHNCGPGFKCRNIQGSFRCDRVTCPPGQKLLSDGSCKVVVCGKGMEPDNAGNCVDINECARSDACRTNQRCLNTVGSYRCQNLLNCSPGYELNEFGNQCVDVDECARRIYECGPQQTCRNRPGGYVCECPRGYALNLQRECEDIDECTRFRGQVCSRMSECINTQGSYVCNCKEGFRKADDDKNCVDIDECAESPNLCQQICNNVWGSYQCSCHAGYTLGADNRSCQDIDECKSYEGHGELCIGYCVNEPGSFSCSCPPGYRLSSDKRTCQDIDECQEQSVCSGDKQVCLNTRGGYKCNRIVCPPNYVRDKDHRNRCKKAVQDCPFHDSECLNQPKSFSYNYITFVSNIRIPFSGQLDLFTMRGPRTTITTVEFNLQFKEARAPAGISPANRDYFHLRRTAYNEAMVSLIKSLQGPQEIELDLVLKMYHNGKFAGNAVAKIFIFVSEHKF